MENHNNLPASQPQHIKPLTTQLIKSLLSDDRQTVEYREKVGALTHSGKMNLELIIQNGTQLSVIQKISGDQNLAQALGFIIVDFAASYNLIRPLSGDQVADIAVELISDYWAYRFEDFIAFFQLARRGTYGKIFDRLDLPTILEMLGKYDAERVELLAQRQVIKQEAKLNLSGYSEADRDEQNRGFIDRSVPIGDYIKRIKSIKDKGGKNG
jgi:hypothetical protein